MRRLLLCLAFSSLAFAQTHDHSPPPSAPSTSAPVASHDHSVLGGELMASLERLDGRTFDRAFLSLMIAHHEAANAMSEDVSKSAQDAKVRTWANEVLLAQRGEVREMRAMLGDFDLGGVDEARYAAMAADMKPMVDEVRTARQLDDAWVSGMARHHALGIVMATVALSKSDNTLIQLLARNIILLQSRQLAEYRAWTADS
ncbi:DUF305 domain-containing protein [Deinococcus yavapaiensis]|uniref:Uncharacterized protein (DUF305 family) n=1 Tax=Deinococcus yavapaiensis KR-236 TaxID=694435 RepID=A0A318S4A6_9DEIO|nr:DUF305 domain-containing protein [Deinococcus yavapaiensis]PYE51888.1 uncharacterized protein (DUF305 family) [Deinococcus yavapaiensis KR-236]